MSAKLNMNSPAPIQWKGNIFSQNSSSIQKNTPNNLTGHSLLFKPNSLNIYRRETNPELIKNTHTNSISRTSTKYDLINLPNGSVLSAENTADCPSYTQELIMPNTSCMRDISNNLCLSSESSAKRRCRSGLIYNNPSKNRKSDTYFISSSQYLANRNKSFEKNMNVYLNVGANCIATHELSNPQFYEQGAVESSSHISKVKFNEITQSGALLHSHSGTGIENVIAYNVGLTTHTYKNKLGFQAPTTPHFNEVDIIVPKIRNTKSYFYNKNFFTNVAIYHPDYDIVTIIQDTVIQFASDKQIEYIVVGGGGSTKILTSVPGVVRGGNGGKVNQGVLDCKNILYTIHVGGISDPLTNGNPSSIYNETDVLVVSDGGLCGELNQYEPGTNKYSLGGDGASTIATTKNGGIGDMVNANVVPVIASTSYGSFIFGYGGGGGSKDIKNTYIPTGRSNQYGTGGNYLVGTPPKQVFNNSGDGAGGYGSLIQPHKPASGAAGIVILAIPKNKNTLKYAEKIGNKTSCT